MELYEKRINRCLDLMKKHDIVDIQFRRRSPS